MAYRCARCNKGRIFGESHRHKPGVAGGQWKKKAPRTQKISMPNLHNFRGFFEGKKGKWRFCTKCLRVVKEEQKEFLARLAKKKASIEAKKTEIKETVEKKTAKKAVKKVKKV